MEVLSVQGDLSPPGAEPPRGLAAGARVRVTKPSTEWDRQVGTIDAVSNNGWVTVALEGGEMKNFREGDLRLLRRDEYGGAEAPTSPLPAGAKSSEASPAGAQPALITVRRVARSAVPAAGTGAASTAAADAAEAGAEDDEDDADGDATMAPAAGEGEGKGGSGEGGEVLEVGLEALRPGWCWSGGKWCGAAPVLPPPDAALPQPAHTHPPHP